MIKEIPSGYRELGDDETITNLHYYLHAALGVRSIATDRKAFIGKTKNQLISAGACAPSRILLAKLEYPHFEGWVGIGVDSPTQEGDSVVIIKPTVTQKKKGSALTPDTGKVVSNYIQGTTLREAFPEDRNILAGRICVYRKVGVVKVDKPRRFPPGEYAKALPLP